MSMCIRPVVETWGESLTYSGRETDIWDVLEVAGRLANEARGERDELATIVKEYDDMNVFYVSDGVAFLSYLEQPAAPTAILDELANEDMSSEDQDEYARQRSDIEDLCKMAALWRGSIDPTDGSLRIYCD